MNYLAYREHSRKELIDKLLKKFQQFVDDDLNLESEIDRVLDDLTHENLLNENRFIEAFVRSKKNKGTGPVKIRYELGQKGIESENIQEHLSLISVEEWIEDIRFQRNKKYGKNLPDNTKERVKQSRFLYQRGYPIELINQVLLNKRSLS